MGELRNDLFEIVDHVQGKKGCSTSSKIKDVFLKGVHTKDTTNFTGKNRPGRQIDPTEGFNYLSDQALYNYLLPTQISTVRCHKCDYCSEKREMGSYVAVEMQDIQGKSYGSKLEDLIAQYYREEILQGDNAYLCPKCQIKQTVSKMLGSRFQLGQPYVVSPKRFINDMSTGTWPPPLYKINKPIDIQEEMTLKLRYPGSPDGWQKVTFRLNSAIMHGGDLTGGHYTAYCPDKKGIWRKFCDLGPPGVSGPVPNIKEILSTCYVFFYEVKKVELIDVDHESAREATEPVSVTDWRALTPILKDPGHEARMARPINVKIRRRLMDRLAAGSPERKSE